MGESPEEAGGRLRHSTCRSTNAPILFEEVTMPRYLVERIFPQGLSIPIDTEGAALCRGVVERNAEESVTWVHSYVSDDRTRTFCVYDGPGPEAIRRAATRSDLPVERITEVRVLDPYFYLT
jgi:hypothetical protein